MAESNLKTRLCSLHAERYVQAVCITHKKLLCITCLTKHMQCEGKDCKRFEVDTPEGHAVLELVDATEQVKNVSIKQEELLKGSKNIEAVIVSEVENFYDMLQTQLKNSKEAIVQKFRSQLASASTEYEKDKHSILEYQSQLTGLIKGFEQDEVTDMESVKADINKIRLALKEMACKELPEWKFVKSSAHEQLMNAQIGSIGPDDEVNSGSTTLEDDAAATSDAVSEFTVAKNDEVSGNIGDYEDVVMSRTLSIPSFVKSDKPSVPKRPSKFKAPNTIKVTIQHQCKRRSPCSFAQVKMFTNKLLILDSAHDVVMIVTQDGTNIAEKSVAPTDRYITVVDSTRFAMLSENPLSITLLEENGNRIRVIRKDMVRQKMVGVVGFAFDPTEKKFAIISQETLCLCPLNDTERGTNGDYIPETVNLLPVIQSSGSTTEPTHSLVRGVYLFPCKTLVFLNTHRQTIKLFDMFMQKLCWKKSLGNDSTTPSDLASDGEDIFISSLTYCIQFSKDGSDTAKYVLDESLGGARSLCVSRSEDVIVMTSKSEDIEGSRNVSIITK